MKSKQTENIKATSLIADDKNFNKGSENGAEMIRKSFEKFGAGRSILLYKNNRIIAGNKSVEYSGIEDVLIVESDGTQLIAVKRTDIDLDSPQGREMALADNASAKANIVFDAELIEAELGEAVCEEWGIDVATKIEAEEDDFDVELPAEPITVLGDLYEIGEHRLLCGDSTDSDQVAKLMNESKFDILVTSPPYNQGNGSGDLLTNGKKEVRLYDDKNADNKSKLEYYDFLISILNIAFIFKNDIHSICWNVSYNAKSRDDYGKIIFSKDNPFTVHETIIWDKGHSINLPQVGIYSRRCEFVFIMSDYDKYLTSQTYNDCRWNVWNISSNKSQTTGEQTEHRAAYPIEFASKMINDFSLIGNLIYEPFTGSGTTMVASHQLKRKCYGMELDPKYCDVIVARMRKLDPSLIIKRNGINIT
jgi:site-specific DNA-methyltransferase (adenine-specific)